MGYVKARLRFGEVKIVLISESDSRMSVAVLQINFSGWNLLLDNSERNEDVSIL